MPWCPNCKTEYREGITHCADCKAELVAELSEKKTGAGEAADSLLVKIDEEQMEFAKRLAGFLEYSGVAVTISGPEDGLISVYTTPEDLRDAKRHFQAFYAVEAERIQEKAAETAFLLGEEEPETEPVPDAEDEEEADGALPEPVSGRGASRDEKNYVSSVSRYEDYRSSGFTFTVFGALGCLFAVLNIMDIIPWFHIFAASIILVMFAAFFVMGIYSFVKAGRLKPEAVKEKELSFRVRAWLNEHITVDTLQAYDEKSNADRAESKSAELLYLNRLDQLRETLLSVFPDLNSSFAEQLIEDFYSARFDA